MTLTNAVIASAQSNANTSKNTNQAAVSPTPEPTPISVSAIVTQAEAVTTRLRAMRTALTDRPDVLEIDEQIPQVTQEIDKEESETAKVLSGGPTLDEIRAIETKWQSILRTTTSWKGTLQNEIAVLDKNIEELNQLSQVWKLTLAATKQKPGVAGSPQLTEPAAELPPEILQRVSETLAAIDETRRLTQERRTELLSIQTRASELDSRASEMRDEVRAARDRTLTNLFVRDERPIWAPREQVVSARYLLEQAGDSFSAQARDLRAYAAEGARRFGLHGLLFILITAGLYWARARIHPFVEKEPKLEKAAQIFALPVATGLILTIILSNWFYPQAPRLLSSLTGAAALVPVVLLLRRMVDRPLFIILNALVVLYFVDLLRDILTNQSFTSRIVFLAEMLGAVLFLTWFLKSKSLSAGVAAAHYRIFESIRRVIPFALAVFAIAFVANVLGFVSLANVIGNGVLGSAYAGLVIYTAVQIIRGIIIFALRVPPLVGTLIVTNNRPLIRERSVRVVRWLGVIIWVLFTLNLFSIRQTLFAFVRDMLAWSVTVGTINLSLGAVVLFVITIWGAVLISRLIRFVLEEDVYPRVDLGGGVSYAVSTMLHYSILVIAFLIAISVLGIDFTKFALIAGAVGIGIGFGLQNVINNFVCGLILLFERPVKVGDMVQLDAHTGKLRQIGLRASVLRKVDGSDVIVPNSMLISEAVTNWTMSDEQRRIDIPVGVAYGTDPKTVLELLRKAAVGYPDVLTDPEPKGIFTGFGNNSLDFELRAWTSSEAFVALRSDLMVQVHTALIEANIEIPFPQRDLHLRTVDKDAAAELAGDTPVRKTP